jgi:uncharacterized protein YoxC
LTKNIKEFVLDNGSTLIAITFFVITFLIFVLAFIHTMKMKKKTVDEIADLALKPDTD